MKYNLLLFTLATFLIQSCSLLHVTPTVEDISNGKVLVIGLIEHDYSELLNKKITGIDVYLGTDNFYKKFVFPNPDIENSNDKSYNFIHTIGERGNYELFYFREGFGDNVDDNLLSTIEKERIEGEALKVVLHRFDFSNKKIVNIGKVTVKYAGGEQQVYKNWGGINYSYSFNIESKDETALNKFKDHYPEIYNTFKNEICTIRSDYEESLEFVLNNISEGKRLFLIQFMEENQDKLSDSFKELNETNRVKIANEIEKFNFDELKSFLTK